MRAGQTVVRLKAGDPFVFGRGAEEVDALRAAGLPVTVVPGITAALGLRGFGRHSVDRSPRRIGRDLRHRPDADGNDAAWPALAAQGHTLAIYMGATEAASVRDRLLDAGADPTTPVAIVENGTRPDERVSTGRLADLARLAATHVSARAMPVPASSSWARWRRAPPPAARTACRGVLMAKNFSGDLQVASANRLGDGVVVFLDDAGQWTPRLDRAALARDKRERARSCSSAPAPRPSPWSIPSWSR